MTELKDLLTDPQLARILLDLLDHPGPVGRQRDATTGDLSRLERDVQVTFSTGLSYTVRPDGERYSVREQTEL